MISCCRKLLGQHSATRVRSVYAAPDCIFRIRSMKSSGKIFCRKNKTNACGDPRSVDTNIGAVVSEAHLGKIFEYLRIAAEEGGRVLWWRTGYTGRPLCRGVFCSAGGCGRASERLSNQSGRDFRSVVTIQPFHSEEEVLAMANDSSYGLASVIWTRHLSRAHRLSETMQNGLVWVNCWMEEILERRSVE